MIGALAARADRPVLAVTATSRETDDLVAALQSLLPPESVVDYPAWETLPHERLSPGVETVGARLMVLRRLTNPDDARLGPPLRVVVTTARKTLTLEYLFEQVRDHNPALHAAYSVTRRLLPTAVRSQPVRINIGELLAVAVKPSR